MRAALIRCLAYATIGYHLVEIVLALRDLLESERTPPPPFVHWVVPPDLPDWPDTDDDVADEHPVSFTVEQLQPPGQGAAGFDVRRGSDEAPGFA